MKSICCDGHIRESFGRNTACCANESYDKRCHKCIKKIIVPRFEPATSLCCDGKIMKRRYGDNSCCCRSRQINIKTQLCCHGRTLDVPLFLPLACCGRKLYNVKSQVCCDGRRRMKEFGDDTQCCERKSMDVGTELCCDGRVVSKKSDNYLTCCGRMAQNPERELCCNGNVQRIPSFMHIHDFQCCGNDLLEVQSQICCANVVHNKHNRHTSCCGSDAYNPLRKMCLFGAVVPRANIPLCAGQKYDNRRWICCANSLQPMHSRRYTACCSDKSYDVRTEVCCEGILFSKPADLDVGCCYGKPLYRRQHLCCSGHRVRKTAFGDDSCCGIRQTYNSKWQLCCHGRVQMKVCGEHTLCCYKRSYDPITDVCCINKVHPRKFGNLTACCGSSTFNPTAQSCCDGKIAWKNIANIKRNREWSWKSGNALRYNLPKDSEKESESETFNDSESLDGRRRTGRTTDQPIKGGKLTGKFRQDSSGKNTKGDKKGIKLRQLKQKIMKLRKRMQRTRDTKRRNGDEEKNKTDLKRLKEKQTVIRRRISKTSNEDRRNILNNKLGNMLKKIEQLERLDRNKTKRPHLPKLRNAQKKDTSKFTKNMENRNDLETVKRFKALLGKIKQLRKRLSETRNPSRQRTLKDPVRNLNDKNGSLAPVRSGERANRKRKRMENNEPINEQYEAVPKRRPKKETPLQKLRRQQKFIRIRITNTSKEERRNLLNSKLGKVLRKIEKLKQNNVSKKNKETIPATRSPIDEKDSENGRNDESRENGKRHRPSQTNRSKQREPAEENKESLKSNIPDKKKIKSRKQDSENEQDVLEAKIYKRKRLRNRLPQTKHPNGRNAVKNEMKNIIGSTEKMTPENSYDAGNRKDESKKKSVREDIGVSYNPEKKRDPERNEPEDGKKDRNRKHLYSSAEILLQKLRRKQQTVRKRISKTSNEKRRGVLNTKLGNILKRIQQLKGLNRNTEKRNEGKTDASPNSQKPKNGGRTGTNKTKKI